MPKLTEYAAAAASGAAALESLFEIYEQAEPSAKAWLVTEFAKATSEYATIKNAILAFKSASLVGKIGKAVTLLSSLLDVTTVLSGIYDDAKVQFAPLWPQIEAQLGVLKIMATKPLALSATA